MLLSNWYGPNIQSWKWFHNHLLYFSIILNFQIWYFSILFNYYLYGTYYVSVTVLCILNILSHLPLKTTLRHRYKFSLYFTVEKIAYTKFTWLAQIHTASNYWNWNVIGASSLYCVKEYPIESPGFYPYYMHSTPFRRVIVTSLW